MVINWYMHVQGHRSWNFPHREHYSCFQVHSCLVITASNESCFGFRVFAEAEVRDGNLSIVQYSSPHLNRRPQQIESRILLRGCCDWPLQIVVDKTLGFWKYSFGFGKYSFGLTLWGGWVYTFFAAITPTHGTIFSLVNLGPSTKWGNDPTGRNPFSVFDPFNNIPVWFQVEGFHDQQNWIAVELMH